MDADDTLAGVDIASLRVPAAETETIPMRKFEQGAPRQLTVCLRKLPDAVTNTRKGRGGRARPPTSGPTKVPNPQPSSPYIRRQPAAAPNGFDRHVACEIYSSAEEWHARSLRRLKLPNVF